MPFGRVKFYDAEKGFGFIRDDSGDGVFFHASALPKGFEQVNPGLRVDYEIVDTKKGKQAFAIRVAELGQKSRHKIPTKPAAEMAVIVEDLVRLMDELGEHLRKGKYPNQERCRKIASVLRKVAQDLS